MKAATIEHKETAEHPKEYSADPDENIDLLSRSKILLEQLHLIISDLERERALKTNYTTAPKLPQSEKDMSFKSRYKGELAEFLGTFVFLFIGYSSNAQMNVGMDVNKGNWVTMVFGWGIGLTIGICIAGAYSGAHLNPTVTFNMWLFRGFPFLKAVRYWVAQFFAAMLASAWSFSLYYPALRTLDPNAWSLPTGGSFYTTTEPGMPVASSWFNEVSGTAILLAMILSVSDNKNLNPVKGLNAWYFGMTITCLGCCAGFYTPFGLNPVRDLGPRLVMSMMGFPKSIWYDHSLWWLVGGITAPTLGGFIGSLAYDLFIYSPPSIDDYPPYRRLSSIRKWWKQHKVHLSDYEVSELGV